MYSAAGNPNSPGYEREHEVRRAVRVHCIPAVALARKRLEPGRFLSGIRRIGLVDELLAGEEVVPREEVLGIEPPREPGVVVRTLGWPVRRPGDRIHDEAGLDVVRNPEHRPDMFVEAVRGASLRLAPVHGRDCIAELHAARRIPGRRAADAAAAPRAVLRSEEHGDVEPVESAGRQEPGSSVLECSLDAGVVANFRAGVRGKCRRRRERKCKPGAWQGGLDRSPTHRPSPATIPSH
jgi:hypothetical protein